MTQDLKDWFISSDVPEHYAVVRASWEEYISDVVEFDVRDVALVAYESPN